MAQNSDDRERQSLYGMDPEEALKKALGTPPPRKFTIGDRVRISQAHDLEYLRGALGTVMIGDPDKRSDGIYAVEFDGATVSFGEGYSVEGMEFEGRFLEPLK